jgi:hypothetical protein
VGLAVVKPVVFRFYQSIHSCLPNHSSLFQSLGYKVFRVPETASLLLGGGVDFSQLDHQQAFCFQKDLLKTMLTIENTFIHVISLFCSHSFS